MRKIHICAALLLLAAQSAPAAVVTQYTYSTTCKPSAAYPIWGDCSTLEQLYARARMWAQTAPRPRAGTTPEAPSIVLVLSETIPISGIFRFYIHPAVQVPVVSYFKPAHTGNLAVDTLAAAQLDRAVTSTRALRLTPIPLPPDKGTARAHVGVVPFVNSTLTRQSAGVDFLWRLAGYNMPQTKYIDVIDERSGELHRVFKDDTITVEFDDGSTLVVKLVQSTTSNALVFAVVPSSARDPKGLPYVAQPHITAQPGNGTMWLPPSAHTGGLLIGPELYCQFPAGQSCTLVNGFKTCRTFRAFVGPC